MPDARSEDGGRKPPGQGLGASSVTRTADPVRPEASVRLMETILGRENMRAAYRRVVANRGAPGVDGMTVDDLELYLVEHRPLSNILLDDLDKELERWSHAFVRVACPRAGQRPVPGPTTATSMCGRGGRASG